MAWIQDSDMDTSEKSDEMSDDKGEFIMFVRKTHTSVTLHFRPVKEEGSE